MNPVEIPVEFDCDGNQLFGVIHRPAMPNGRGVVILTGGYLCGPHRWFVIQARVWARAGYTVMRFSARGTGDSEGRRSDFEDFDDFRPDVTSAVDEFFRREPSLKEVALWGVCAQASAALLYAPTDSRVSAVVLVNLYLGVYPDSIPLPGERAAALSHLRRLLGRVVTIVFWRKILLLGGTVDWVSAFRRMKRHLLLALGARRTKDEVVEPISPPPLLEKLADAFREFHGRALFVFSGRDVEAVIARNLLMSPAWLQLCSSKPVSIRELDGADHTFSRRGWSDQVGAWTLEWLRSWR